MYIWREGERNRESERQGEKERDRDREGGRERGAFVCVVREIWGSGLSGVVAPRL